MSQSSLSFGVITFGDSFIFIASNGFGFYTVFSITNRFSFRASFFIQSPSVVNEQPQCETATADWFNTHRC
jgi:hypothetical protein